MFKFARGLSGDVKFSLCMRLLSINGSFVLVAEVLCFRNFFLKKVDQTVSLQCYSIFSTAWFNVHHTNLIFLRTLFRCLCLSIWSAVSIPLSVENSFSSYSMISPSSILFSSDVISSYSSYNKLLVSTDNNKGFVLKFY